HRPDPPAAPCPLGAMDGGGHDRRAGLERKPPDATLRLAERALAVARALREDDQRAAALQDLLGRLDRLLVRLAAPDREGAEAVEEPAREALLEQLLLRHEVDGAVQADADDERVEEAAVVRREDHGAIGHVLAADPLHAEVGKQERFEDRARDREYDGLHAARAGALVVDRQGGLGCGGRVAHPYLTTPQVRARYAAGCEAASERRGSGCRRRGRARMGSP